MDLTVKICVYEGGGPGTVIDDDPCFVFIGCLFLAINVIRG